MKHYKSEAEIEAVVHGLETCSAGKNDFPHSKHLVVAVWYLRDSTAKQAFAKMRDSLLRFIEHHGIDKKIYKEALTRAWIDLVDEEMKKLDPHLPIVTIVNIIIERLSDPAIVFTRYPDNMALQRDHKQS